MLTHKQESFCIAYIETGNASEAYRQSYSAKNMKPETINRNAKKLIDDNKIATRIQELRKPAVEAAQITLEGHLRDLEDLRNKAMEANQYSAAITAEVNRGKVAGLYVERTENVNTNYVVESTPLSVDEWQTKHKPSGDRSPAPNTH